MMAAPRIAIRSIGLNAHYPCIYYVDGVSSE
jgi:hypothetical protein